MILDEYILNLPKIGEGSYGEVYLTSKKNSKEIFATKKVEKQKIMSEKLRQYFLNEIEILKKLNHPNIMQLIEIKSSHNNIYLITEYCNGGTLSENLTLHQKLHKTPLPEKIVIHLMKEIADAIHYLHEQRIIHRDLKMENILLHFENLDDRKKLNLLKAKVKIIDFGFARYLNNDSISTSIVGSPLNMAPDILHALADSSWRMNLKYNEKADIYSIGVIMFILLIGKPPFNAGDYKDLYSKVNYGIYSIPKDLKLSKECITLMNGMMMQESEKRFSVMEVLRSDFLMKPYEKFEMVDFLEFENTKENFNNKNNKNDKNNNKNNYVLQQNENNIFLDIKQMINLEYKKQTQLNKNINSNKENLNMILNDMNNKDKELELLLEQLKTNKIDSNKDININNFNSNNAQKNANPNNNFLANQEDKANAAYNINKIPEANNQVFKNLNANYNENKGKFGENKAKEDELLKQKEKEKEKEKEKSNYHDLDGHIRKPSNANNVFNNNNVNNVNNNNLINLENYENIKGYFKENPNIKRNSDKNLANIMNKDDAINKGIFDIPMEKLDGIFEMINKKFEMFEMEAIPIYLENPQQYENFIL
jgi:serine/threonine-protein kinase ULK/ATG1